MGRKKVPRRQLAGFGIGTLAVLCFLAAPAWPAANSGSASSSWLETFRQTLRIWMGPQQTSLDKAIGDLESEIISTFGRMPDGNSQTVLGDENAAYQVRGPWATWHSFGEATSSEWQLEVYARPEDSRLILRLLPDLRNAWISHSVAVHGPTFRQWTDSGGGGSAKFLVLHPANPEQRRRAIRLLSSALHQNAETLLSKLSDPENPGLDLSGGAHRVYAVTGIAFDPNQWAYDGGIDCRMGSSTLCSKMGAQIARRRDDVAQMKLDFALATERDEGSRRPASESKPGSGPRFGITTGPIDALEEFSNNVIQLGLTRDGKPDPSLRCEVVETSGDIPFASCDLGQNLSISTASAAEGRGEVRLRISDSSLRQELVFSVTVRPKAAHEKGL